MGAVSGSAWLPLAVTVGLLWNGAWVGAVPTAYPPLARYQVDLDAPACERWAVQLADAIGQVGVEPFFDYFKAVADGLEATSPETLAYYRRHLDAFEASYAALLPDALAEVHCLADTLRNAARTPVEQEVFGRQAVFLVQLHMQIGNIGPLHGECTSVVVRRPRGQGVAHFRNWDFGPLPERLGQLSVEVDFVFSSSGRPGFRCLLALTHIDKWTTCMKPGAFSMSLNARGYGAGHERGRPPAEELALLRSGRLPRVAVLRKVMLAASYEEALVAAMTTPALTSMYVILAAPGLEGAGAVVTLEGNGSSSDVLHLPEDDWFLVQTNVDHMTPTSDKHVSSHRRDHVKALLRGLGPEASLEALYGVLQNQDVYPSGNIGPDDGRVFRPSTVASALMRPAAATAPDESWHTDVWRLPHAGDPGTAAAQQQQLIV